MPSAWAKNGNLVPTVGAKLSDFYRQQFRNSCQNCKCRFNLTSKFWKFYLYSVTYLKRYDKVIHCNTVYNGKRLGTPYIFLDKNEGKIMLHPFSVLF